MRPTLRSSAIALLLVTAVPLSDTAKVRDCGALADRLATLEADPNANAGRTAKLARRYADHCVHLNEIQVLGSHNSYHIQPRPDLFALLVAFLPETMAWAWRGYPR